MAAFGLTNMLPIYNMCYHGDKRLGSTPTRPFEPRSLTTSYFRKAGGCSGEGQIRQTKGSSLPHSRRPLVSLLAHFHFPGPSRPDGLLLADLGLSAACGKSPEGRDGSNCGRGKEKSSTSPIPGSAEAQEGPQTRTTQTGASNDCFPKGRRRSFPLLLPSCRSDHSRSHPGFRRKDKE